MFVACCRQRGRGQMGAKSPLLWDEGQAEALLEGSPVVNMIKERLQVTIGLGCVDGIVLSLSASCHFKLLSCYTVS